MRRSSSVARVVLPDDLALQPLGDARHARKGEVVLRHPAAELLPRRLHQGLRVGFFDAADEQPEKATDQPSDAPKHVETS